jgi:hypothetical protein
MENSEKVIDPGAMFASDIEAALMELDFPNDVSDMLMESLPIEDYALNLPPLLKNYNLPDHLEELFTLREKRYQVFIISGIQESKDKRSISFVAVMMPLMAWEWYKFIAEEFEGERPDWVPKASYDSLWMQSDALEVDFSNPLRFYYPVLAEYVEDPFNNKQAYETRRKALVSTIELLYERFDFQIRFSESGDIPKEISEEWLSKEIKEDYNDHMLYLDRKLKEEPSNVILYYEKAGLLLSRERNQDALVFLQKAIELDPNLPQIWYLLSDVYTKMDRMEDAKEAESKAQDIQIALGMPENKSDLYYLLNPINPVYYEIKDTSSFPVRERFVCGFCTYDHIYVRDGIWYSCNACGEESAIQDASLGVEISSSEQKLGPDWADHMVLDVTLTNKTKYGIALTTEMFEIVVDTVEEEDINENEEKMITDFKSFCFAHMPEPHMPIELKPNEVKRTQIHLKDLKWYDDDKKEKLSSGKYALFLFVQSNVDTDWGEMGSVSESNTLFIHH